MGGYNASFSTGANPAKLILTDYPSFSLSYKNKYMGLANVTIASILFNYRISEKCSKLEYFEVRNKNNLRKKINRNNFKIFIAYYLDDVRLIDNF